MLWRKLKSWILIKSNKIHLFLKSTTSALASKTYKTNLECFIELLD